MTHCIPICNFALFTFFSFSTAGPQVTLSKKTASAAIGDDVELDCSVTGYPPPYVSWSREGGRALPSNSLITKKKGKDVWTLVLSIGADSYYGNYQCTAVNFLSSSTAVASVESEDGVLVQLVC